MTKFKKGDWIKPRLPLVRKTSNLNLTENVRTMVAHHGMGPFEIIAIRVSPENIKLHIKGSYFYPEEVVKVDPPNEEA